MRIVQLRAQNFRLFETLSLQTHCRLNFIFGANAAGKTSLLEALYTLGRGKSFRGSTPGELAGVAGRHWLVFGRVEAADTEPRHRVGVRWQDGVGQVRVDGQAARNLDLLRLLPVQVLEPGMHRMLQEGPSYRRSFLDWGVFHVEPSFLPTWSRYRRALRQRNQALRQNASDRELAVWEPELAEAGERLDALRRTHLADIGPTVQDHVRVLLDEGEWNFELLSGWGQGLALREALLRQRTADRRLGTTQAGPHRAELRVRAGGHGIRHRISRGQQKLLIAALLLAQCTVIGRSAGRYPVLLVDDFGAELAERYQATLLAALVRYPGQVFVTAFERSGVLATVADAALFHVERGVLRPDS
ncbi:DNA replication/repair protein RecF [Fontimonas sp. SYSU GA230001]|uniref:DNA replication/repair protein RecF n=1 Tax=Fontimonas sp. SYSU GA230001 TaxID=3142450 RepID=UPI0032B5BAE7